MYADKIVLDSFEKNSYCDTVNNDPGGQEAIRQIIYIYQDHLMRIACLQALYGDNGDDTISVHNYATIGSANGTVYTIDGYAYTPDPDEPGKLKVHFDSDDAAPFDAPYW